MAAALMAGAIVLGSALLWIAIPVGTFWLASKVTDDSVRGVLFALLVLPAAMAGGAFGLYRLNAVYERLRGADPGPRRPPSWRGSLGEGRGMPRPPRLIDVAMTASAVVALVLFLIWYFASPDLRLAPLG
jgi:formate hydrogenlyase subunit 3/multisubunit Na+/H+ antiporter MnhD subunit